MISKGSVKPARRQFSSVDNEFELGLDSNSIITPVRTRAGSTAGVGNSARDRALTPCPSKAGNAMRGTLVPR